MRFKVAHSYVILPLALVTAVFAQGPHSGANLPGVNASAAQATPSALAFSRPQIVAELNAHPSWTIRLQSRRNCVYIY